MPSYRLTIYVDGLIDRVLPFEAAEAEDAMTFSDSERYGQHAVLSDAGRLVRTFPAD